MATKTISLRLEAYEWLERARRDPREPFSDVVMRGEWPGVGATGGDLLTAYERRSAYFTEASLDRMEEAKTTRDPPAPSRS